MISVRIIFICLAALLCEASALAVNPVVTTNPATGITDLSATLNGVANANWNGSLFIYFEYGKTTSYGGVGYPAYDSISGNTTYTVTYQPPDLVAGTTYHYRLRGYSNTLNQIFYGSDQTFTTTTPATPPTVGTPLSGVTSHSATVGVTSITTGSSPATVTFEYGLTAAYGSSVAYGSTLPANSSTGGAPLYVDVPGLAPSTTYHYRCNVSNAQGTVSTSDATFTTVATPILTTGSATGISDLTATLNGTVAPNGGSLAVSFDVGPTTSYGLSGTPSPQGVSGTGTVPFSGTTSQFSPNTTYHYRVKAWDSTNTYFYGDDMTFTTGAPATPPTFGGVDYIAKSTVSAVVYFYFNNLSSGSSPATLTIDYGPSTAYGSTASYPTTIPTNTTMVLPQMSITGLAPGTTYHYRVTLANGEGSVSSADSTLTTVSLVQAWRQQHFGTTENTGIFADTASYARDGVSNLMKYALGLDPTVANAGALPVVQLKNDSGNIYLSYTFPRDPAKTDLTYQVMAASSLSGPWTPIVTSAGGAAATGPGLVTEAPGSGGVINVEVRDTFSATSAATRFLKLVVTDATE